MFKKSQDQSGSTHVIIIVILIVVVLGMLGYVYYKSSTKVADMQASKTTTQPDSNTNTSKAAYTLDDAIESINKTLSMQACEGSGLKTTLAANTFNEVKDSDQFNYKGGQSTINTGLTYAFVQYGCGSQGSVALLKKTDDTWKLISEDARIYPMCDAVRGEGFPLSIVDKCYTDDRAVDPVAI